MRSACAGSLRQYVTRSLRVSGGEHSAHPAVNIPHPALAASVTPASAFRGLPVSRTPPPPPLPFFHRSTGIHGGATSVATVRSLTASSAAAAALYNMSSSAAAAAADNTNTWDGSGTQEELMFRDECILVVRWPLC